MPYNFQNFLGIVFLAQIKYIKTFIRFSKLDNWDTNLYYEILYSKVYTYIYTFIYTLGSHQRLV